MSSNTNVTAENATLLMAPGEATRPNWLPNAGLRQMDINPESWGMTIEQWLCFVNKCQRTPQWQVLAAAKGEGNINMYDMKDTFVVCAMVMWDRKQHHTVNEPDSGQSAATVLPQV